MLKVIFFVLNLGSNSSNKSLSFYVLRQPQTFFLVWWSKISKDNRFLCFSSILVFLWGSCLKNEVGALLNMDIASSLKYVLHQTYVRVTKKTWLWQFNIGCQHNIDRIVLECCDSDMAWFDRDSEWLKWLSLIFILSSHWINSWYLEYIEQTLMTCLTW